MPAGPFQKVIFDRKCPFYVVIRGDSTNIFFSSKKLAREDFLRHIVARSIKRLGTAGLDKYTLGFALTMKQITNRYLKKLIMIMI
jgi:hypothetical protein